MRSTIHRRHDRVAPSGLALADCDGGSPDRPHSGRNRSIDTHFLNATIPAREPISIVVAEPSSADAMAKLRALARSGARAAATSTRLLHAVARLPWPPCPDGGTSDRRVIDAAGDLAGDAPRRRGLSITWTRAHEGISVVIPSRGRPCGCRPDLRPHVESDWDVRETRRAVRAGRRAIPHLVFTERTWRLTLGIIGMVRIGGAVARRSTGSSWKSITMIW